MTQLKIYSRQDWKARAANPMSSQGTAREAFIHHSEGDGRLIDTFGEQCATVRSIQNFHMDGRGWSDIAYHYIVFQPNAGIERARVFKARRNDAVPAAQQGHNTGTIAICVVGNMEREAVKRNTVWTLERLLREELPGVKTVGGHRDVVATSCPGEHLYAEIDRIARQAGKLRFKAR